MRVAKWYDRSRGWTLIGLGVLAIVAIVVGSLALSKSNSAAGTGSHGTFPTVAPVTKHPIAVFLGGSFTQGAGASGVSKSWPILISQARGWESVSLAGTADDIFSATGNCPTTGCTADKSIVASVVSATPRIVVIGAQLDTNANLKTVTATVAATMQAIRLALPSVDIIAVGPTQPPGGDDTRLLALDSAYRSIASNTSATYVSLLSPTGLNSTQFGTNSAWPNNSGQAAIAQRIQASLSS